MYISSNNYSILRQNSSFKQKESDYISTDDYLYLLSRDRHEQRLKIKDTKLSGEYKKYDVNGDGVFDCRDLQILGVSVDKNKTLSMLKLEDFYSRETQTIDGINRKVDYSRQGIVGDCWLLSALNSLKSSKRGEKIIKHSIIPYEKKGIYVVNLKGIKRKYKITREELTQARELDIYSHGDNDVLLIELAFNKLREDIKAGKYNPSESVVPNKLFLEQENLLNGGQFKEVIKILTGKDSKCISSDFNQFLDIMKLNPKNYAAMVCFKAPEGSKGAYIVKDIFSKDVVLSIDDVPHSWSITNVTDTDATIINPWNSEEKFILSKSVINDNAQNIEYYKYPVYKRSLMKMFQYSSFFVAIVLLASKLKSDFISGRSAFFKMLYNKKFLNIVISPDVKVSKLEMVSVPKINLLEKILSSLKIRKNINLNTFDTRQLKTINTKFSKFYGSKSSYKNMLKIDNVINSYLNMAAFTYFFGISSELNSLNYNEKLETIKLENLK